MNVFDAKEFAEELNALLVKYNVGVACVKHQSGSTSASTTDMVVYDVYESEDKYVLCENSDYVDPGNCSVNIDDYAPDDWY